MPEQRHARGLLDTSVVIDLVYVAAANLPREFAISTLTLAELAAGPHSAVDPAERARRQEVAQRAELFDPLPFDVVAARAFGRVSAEVTAAGQKVRGSRAVDLLIAASALAHGLPLYTRNPSDFRVLGDLLEVVPVP
ncbi:MAG: type II toxin-antitoxin system VapC family toxin [Candidatus Dormibacteria bacterium]